MSTFAIRTPVRARSPWSLRAARDEERAGARPLLLRLAAVLAVGAFALVRWLDLIVGRPRGAAVAEVAAAAAAGLIVLGAGRVRSRALRWPLVALAVVLALVVALLAAGVALRLLAPRRWDLLLTGLGDGFAALPGLNVPYTGVNAWARVALLLSGGALLAAATIAATWPRRSGAGARGMSLLALAVLFTIPAIELTGAHPWVSGAVFAVGVGAVLHAERLSVRRLPFALGAFAVATLLAMWVAPGLDRSTPLIDVQALASKLQPTATITFDWNHHYGPLHWPRDGRQVLRVQARVGAYWKVETLDAFDGARWVARPSPAATSAFDTEIARGHPDWRQQIQVTIESMRTSQFPGAADVLHVDRSPREPIHGTKGTFVSAGTPLSRGDAYRATVYVPRPSSTEMRTAGTTYPAFVQDDLVMNLPGVAKGAFGGRPDEVAFSAWGSGGLPVVYGAQGIIEQGSADVLSHSPYARMYALSQRIAARASTPYDYVKAVERYFGSGFTYDEDPPRHALALPAFLFSDKRGYCQQFSGAMALMLRMGGVPARVATGFSPGTFDRGSGEYVVRDTDAHSWVEAYFPQFGWVTFDPTPAIAPARSQLDSIPAPTPAGGGRSSGGSSRTQAHARADVGVRAASTPLLLRAYVLVPAVLGLLLLAGVVVVVWRERRLRRGQAPVDAELAELDRALRRAGRPPLPETTLIDLERLLGGSDDAAGYLRAVRFARYGHDDRGPTPEQRRALRRALGEGLGATGRMRALWALPPHPAARRRVH